MILLFFKDYKWVPYVVFAVACALYMYFQKIMNMQQVLKLIGKLLQNINISDYLYKYMQDNVSIVHAFKI